MSSSLSDALALIDRGRAAGEAALRPAGRAADRAAALAGALRQVWPAAALAACRVEDAAGPAVAALDGEGRPRPEWADALRQPLAGPAGSAEAAGHRLRVAPI